MPTRITLKMIAAKAGVHITTVSLALKDHPSLPEATRQRIKDLAAEMGYVRDPMLSALVAYRTNNRLLVKQGVLAWVDVWPTPGGARERYAELWQGAFDRAEKLGWKLEAFRPVHTGITLPQCSRILRARGIQGVILAPLPGDQNSIELEWPWFSAVSPSHSLVAPRLHRIVTHQAHNMRVLCQKFHSLGYRRPGLALKAPGHAINQNWFHSFVGFQYEQGDPARIIPPLVQHPFDGPAFLAWFRQHQPDVLILPHPTDYVSALKSAGVRIPEDVIIGVPRPPVGANAETSWSINECWLEIGRHTVDILVGMLHRNEKGVPTNPLTISVDGVLQETSR
jgi:DNA-binding LacI/PurR family transcriptional regulator